jgi:uncharacterized protein
MSNRNDDHGGESAHADLLADVSRAAEIVAPLWPLTNFVAVNPLLGLQHLPFDDATAVARRWLRARTHLTLAAFRDAYDRGAITDADLRRAVIEVDPKLALQPSFEIGERTVDAVEVVRLDLLVGPDDKPRDTTGDRVGRTDVATVRAVSQLVAAWCAVFVDEAGVPWPMPGREHGFFRAWRELALHDRRLRRLAGPAGMRWLAQLPERPVEALAASLDALAVGGDRVEALREHLGRLPGWAGYARWNDEWAPPGHERPPLRLLDLLAAQVAATAAAAHGADSPQPPQDRHQELEKLLEDRVAAVLGALGSTSDDPLVTSAVRDVLEQVPPPVRKSMWLEAQEGNFRDRLLGLLSRPEPGPGTDRPDVQAAFCIDARSEGLRRHLEACGPYETLGFAGFFGVPVRWRPLGSTESQPRCPPLLPPPEHEVVEQPLVPDGAAGYLTAQRAAGAGHEAFHAPKGSLPGPFALAEAAGYVMGPVAAVRTLAPGAMRRLRGLTRRVASPQTRPAVEAERDGSGLTLEERTSSAESVVRTMGLTRFGRLIVLCGHGSHNINNPHASSYDCGACGGAPGGPSARVVVALLNDPGVRAGLEARGIIVPDDTRFVAAQHDTVSDTVTVLDRQAVPESHERLVEAFERDVALAGERLARERAGRLPGDPGKVRVRGYDWAQVRPEWGLAANAAFVVGPRSITAELDLACRVFLHSYDAEGDGDGTALQTILTAPLVVGQWISAQYYFSSVDPDQFGAGDKTLHNPVGGIGVVLGEGGDLQVGLPAQAVGIGERRIHEPLRLLAVVQAPIERIEAIIQRNEVLQQLFGGKWMTLAARSHGNEQWSIRSPGGSWTTWSPADGSADHSNASLEVR